MERMRKPNIDAYLTVIVKDKNGKVVLRKGYKSRSFVVGFLNALYTVFTSPPSAQQWLVTLTLLLGQAQLNHQ